jgi:UDP-N-acetylmuramoyl-L-alanyl-D-glutamate--2,6-diaminopimelate ligase
MKLTKLIEALGDKRIYGPQDIDIAGIVYDSRQVTPGTLFVAIRGLHTDGHQHVPSAIEKGAAAVVVDREVIHGAVTTIQVPDSRKALALLATRWYREPAAKLRLIGITGTDGKTTTSYLLRALLQAAGHRTGLIGTVSTSIGKSDTPSAYTTPEAPELQGCLHQMVSQGEEFVVMEVSSHALAMDRVYGIPYEMAVFTNLSRDHLDFHGDFEHYRDAKALLFKRLQGQRARAVINRDDPHAQFMMERTTVPVITFSAEKQGDVHLLNARLTMEGSELEIRTPAGRLQLRSPLLGRYNVFNTLAAVAAGIALDLSLDSMRQGVEGMSGVDGRFETMQPAGGFTVIIDYAHTPQALTRLLGAVREMSPRRILLVFGCGGDRDRGKRPEMADAASQLADMIFLTTDNPRSEDPLEILRQAERGILPGTPHQVVPDRREAIRQGLRSARPGDVLVIAGRGHEPFQIVGEQKIPFLDRTVVLEELERLDEKENRHRESDTSPSHRLDDR